MHKVYGLTTLLEEIQQVKNMPTVVDRLKMLRILADVYGLTTPQIFYLFRIFR